MLTIGREGKWQGFETDSGGPEHLYEESERGRDLKQKPSRSLAPIAREGKGKGFETENQEVLIRTYTRRGKEARI